MTNINENDVEKNALDKQRMQTEKTRRVLKWAVIVSLFTLVCIIAVVVPMALKAVEKSNKYLSSAAEQTPGNGGNGNDKNLGPGKPNGRPTLSPTRDPESPTRSPTPAPTGTPHPSGGPTISFAPTKPPTKSPTFNPTDYPTGPPPSANPTPIFSSTPTLSQLPTIAPIDPNYAFKLRLFWQTGYYWQETWEEVFYCVECVECEEYGGGDGNEHGCDKREDDLASECKAGDMFWIMECDDRGAQFNIVDNPGSGYQLRLDGTDLCVIRGGTDPKSGNYKSRILRATKCDSSDGNQLWAPFPYLNKFELRPVEDGGKAEADAFCISQLHHPKPEEVLSMHSCRLSRIYETRYWEEWN